MTDIERKLQRDAARGSAPHDARPTHRASFGAVDDLIGRVADSEVTVLLRGERGTGKEFAARAIHAASTRRDQPFIKINCGASPQVLTAELFGCERGDNGGFQRRPGRLEFANRGTLFLDHVSELPLTLQVRLHRVLQDGAFARAGASEAVRVDVRVIAATEHDLERAVAEGRFREELFFRLNVVCLTLSPLRQRRAEIRALAEFFARRYASHYNKPEAVLTADTLRVFSEYGWPGNIQELDAVVKRIVTLGADGEVLGALLDEPPPGREPTNASLDAEDTSSLGPTGADVESADVPGGGVVPLKEIARHAAEGAERALIYRTLQQTRWNRREAAEMLGVSYKALLYKIKRAELDGAS